MGGGVHAGHHLCQEPAAHLGTEHVGTVAAGGVRFALTVVDDRIVLVGRQLLRPDILLARRHGARHDRSTLPMLLQLFYRIEPLLAAGADEAGAALHVGLHIGQARGRVAAELVGAFMELAYL
jgi:hypothetical protein